MIKTTSEKPIFQPSNLLRVAVPRKGRLKEHAFSLLRQAGYSLPYESKALSYIDEKASIEFFFLRTEDIPVLVEKEILHIGITGLDLIEERGKQLLPIMHLPFGHCRLCVAGLPSNLSLYKKKLQSKKAGTLRIVTSFPNISNTFFKKKGVIADSIVMQGSVEIMVGLHNADAIVDLVESGETLRKNGLVIFEEINHYQCAIFQRGNDKLQKIKKNSSKNSPLPISFDNKKSKISAVQKKSLNIGMQTFLKRVRGIAMAKEYSILEYNLPKKLLKTAEAITPGFDAPTVSHLDNPNLVAIKVMIKKSYVHDAMDALQALGATGIYELTIKNSRL